MNTKLVFTFFSLLFAYATILANNVQVSGITRIGANRDRVQFELSWENSWNFTNIPSNHDAVWVFIKYRECGVGGNWHHALLSTTMSEHTLPATLAAARPITTTDRLGNPGAHNTGILIRRATIGHGNIVPQTVTLAISGASDGIILDNTKEYDIKVFAIEMVQVLSGAFYCGDGVSSNRIYTPGTGYNTYYGYMPYKFKSETAIDTICYGYYDYKVYLPTNFPKGVDEFYCMKYELSQGQYCDFLNTVSSMQALNRVYIYNGYGYQISFVADKYTTIYPNRAMAYMSFNDLRSYLDWAALRPMSELEYEKTCRGPLDPIPYEFAWGTSSYIEAKNFSGTISGQEICTDSAANLHFHGSTPYVYGGIFGSGTYCGILEVGVFARDNTLGRVATGGAYYGAMEMSGNVWELCILTHNSYVNPAISPTYTGVWGDGQLDAMGLFNTINWAAPYYMPRGGSMDADAGKCMVSDRYYWTSSDHNYHSYGGRGVR